MKRCFSDRLCRSIYLGGQRSVAIGGFHLLQELSADLGLSPGSRIAIAGFGRVGRHAVRLLDQAGYAVVAAGDSGETVAAHSGMQVAKLLAAKDAGLLGGVCAERGVARQAAGAAIGSDCDLLVVAGPAGMVHRGNAREVRARVVLELTDGGVDADADEILDDRGIVVVPDLLATAGAAAERHLDRVLDGGVGGWTSVEVDDWLVGLMLPTARLALGVAQAQGVSLRRAAHLLALTRLAAGSQIWGGPCG